MIKLGRYREVIIHYGRGFLNSYSQVFFSDHPLFAILILLVTFLVPASGFAGAAGVAVSLILANLLRFDKVLISKGVYSYNTLLVTLPLGLFFKFGLPLVLVIILASLLTFFLTVFFRGRMQRSNLPFLSWPFVIGLWIVMTAVRHFTAIEVGDQALFEWSRVYRMGGITLVKGMEWLNTILLPAALKTYLISLGAVFFQYNLIAGLAVAIGLVIYSRIAFLLSLLGFFTAYLFYSVIGLDINALDYSYIGFNYILSAIAVGGFFLIPSVYTFIWAIILIPLVALLSVSMEEVLSPVHLGIYALPFNLVVPLFLFGLQQRTTYRSGLRPVVIQHNSPEKNLYAWSNYRNRLSRKTGVQFRLPVLGRWKVSQGHNGSHTHQADWRFAWDFVREGPDGKSFTGSGAKSDDYHCFGTPVYPAADGVVDSVTDGVEDNIPGDANTRQNWGNTVIIRHTDGIYSKYSHLRKGTVRVKPGEFVLTGTELAQVGNSGRSPFPHLHFQFQAEPWLDAATIDYPFAYYLLDRDGVPALRTYDHPAENDIVSNLITDRFLARAFHFIPGQKIRVAGTAGNGKELSGIVWEVHTDYYNNSYILDRMGGATAWFVNDGQLFYFTHYEGERHNPLFSFFSSCFKVPLIFDRKLTVTDQLPLSVFSRSWVRWLQDWVAPFHIFVRSAFSLNFEWSDDVLEPAKYRLISSVDQQVFNHSAGAVGYQVEISRGGLFRIKTGESDVLELETQIS